MLLEAFGQVEDFGLVEDASEVELISYAHEMDGDPLDEDPTQSLFEAKVEETYTLDNLLLKDPSSLDVSTTKRGESFVLSLTPKVTTARYRHNSYDKSSLRRNARFAQRNILKELDFLGRMESLMKLNLKSLQIF